MTTDKETAISCLMHAINDSQEAIRAYDSKAEILGVLLTLVVGMTNYALFEHSAGHLRMLLLVSWLVALATVLVTGLVLYPRKNPFKKIALGTFTPSGAYYLTNLSASPQDTIEVMVKKAINTDWVSELMYESMKLSAIRDFKHNYFIWALRLSGLTILLIATAIIISIWAQ
jgi:hypothetical protein